MIEDELFELDRLTFRVELLNRDYRRVMRWPGVLAVVISVLSQQIVSLLGAPPWARYLAAFVAGFAAMSWLAHRAWDRYVQRQWNSLEA